MYFILMPMQINKPGQGSKKTKKGSAKEERITNKSAKHKRGKRQTGLAQLHARPSAINEAGFGLKKKQRKRNAKRQKNKQGDKG